jgi:hypothetical protein
MALMSWASQGELSMNPFERDIRTVDAWQQRHRVPAFAFAVLRNSAMTKQVTSSRC